MIASVNQQVGMSREANRFEATFAWKRAITGDPEAFRTETVIVDRKPEKCVSIAGMFTIALNELGIDYHDRIVRAHYKWIVVREIIAYLDDTRNTTRPRLE